MFRDSPAIVPLLVAEPRFPMMTDLLRAGKAPAVGWGTVVECQSAIHRRNRELPMPKEQRDSAFQRMEAFLGHCDTVAPAEEVRRRAGRLLSIHVLRAADAFQLAAALVFAEEEPGSVEFVCLDDRLREAAEKEGFLVRPVSG